MKVDIEFIGPLREKAGAKYTTIDITVSSGETDTVRVLKEVEYRFRAEKLKLLKGTGLMPGLLLFIRKPTGGIERLKLEASFKAEDNLELVVAPMMDGG